VLVMVVGCLHMYIPQRASQKDFDFSSGRPNERTEFQKSDMDRSGQPA